MSARNPLIVRADICGFSARSSAEKVKFSVSCTVHCNSVYVMYILYIRIHNHISIHLQPSIQQMYTRGYPATNTAPLGEKLMSYNIYIHT